MDSPLIVINNGMAKSGSTLLTEHTRLLVRHRYPVNGQRALCGVIHSGKISGVAYGKGEIEAGAFVTNIGEHELAVLTEIAASEGPLVVKTHCNLNPVLAEALQHSRVCMTITHRDPRDMILSGMDHCIQTRNSDYPSLQEFTSIADSIVSARWWALATYEWVASGLTHVIPYTDLVSEPARVLAGLAEYLGIPVESGFLDALIKQEREQRTFGRLRFNRGELHRFSKEMSPADQALCQRELGDVISMLGYPLQYSV